MYTPIESKNNYQYIIAQIKQMILNGELKVGDQLPVERDLCEMFNVSRSSVREALKALEAIGIVECRHGGGNFVVNHLMDSLSDSLSLAFTLGNWEIHDLTELRQIIETATLKEIADLNDPADYQKLDALADRIRGAKTIKEIINCDIAFHTLISTMSKNPLLNYIEHTFHTVYLRSVEVLNYTYDKVWELNTAKEYQLDILNALYTRDHQQIEAAVARHYSESYDILQ